MTARRTKTLLGAVAAAALTIAGTTAVADPAADPPLSWGTCADGSVQCATVTVPVDHDDPDGEHIELALARLPAQDPATRRGTVVFHGGGPAPSLPTLLDPQRRGALTELTRWFDVVTFDSRGYGQSTPICDPAIAPAIAPADSPATYAANQRNAAAYGESCRADHPTLAEHVSSQDTAHDVDVIRVALGEEQITFYGSSYGTVIGQEYAEHHGDRLRRLLLDSVADHTADYPQQVDAVAQFREAALHRFAQDCAADAGCPLAGTDPLAVWDEVVAAAERAPLPAGDGTEVTAQQIRHLSGNFSVPYMRNSAAAALRLARSGDGSGFAAMLAVPGQIGDVGQLTECADFAVRPDDYDSLLALAEQARANTPRIGWLAPFSTLTVLKCAGWPLPATNVPTPLDAPDAPPALLVNASLDGATHLAGARRVADRIPGSAVLVGTGFGHSLYQYGPANRCIRDAVHRYLLDGDLPEAGAECPL